MLRYARARVATKNTLASTAVVRDRKLALPEAPNRLPDAPLPKAAPMSAPLPCCIRIRPTMASADTICATSTRFKTKFMLVYSKINSIRRPPIKRQRQ